MKAQNARQGERWEPGWREEFEAFYRSNHGKIHFFLRGRCTDDQLVDDILQEVFSMAYVKWPAVRKHPKPLAWVYCVAVNKSSEAFRDATAQRRLHERLPRIDAMNSTDPHRQTDDILLCRQLLRQLPPSEAHALLLLYLGWSEKETASILNVTLHTCRTYKKNARSKLREAAEGLRRSEGGAA